MAVNSYTPDNYAQPHAQKHRNRYRNANYMPRTHISPIHSPHYCCCYYLDQRERAAAGELLTWKEDQGALSYLSFLFRAQHVSHRHQFSLSLSPYPPHHLEILPPSSSSVTVGFSETVLNSPYIPSAYSLVLLPNQLPSNSSTGKDDDNFLRGE